MLARRVLARTAARPAMASALRGASLRATAAAKASACRAAAAVAAAGRAPTVASARPALMAQARVWMGELAYKKDARIPEVVGQLPSRNARLPITDLPFGPDHIGKDHMPPPVFDQPFRPYKSRQISDKYSLGIIENPMTDPYLVDKTLITDAENDAFKRYRYPAWAWAGLRGAWRYVVQTLRGRKLWEPITDQHFCTIFSRNWPYRSLLTRHKAGDTKEEKEYVLDVTVMSKLIPYQPYFTEGCKVFFRRPIIPADHDGPARGQSDLEGYRVMRIDRIEMVSGNGGVSDVKRPDGSTPEQEWDLVKMFAMQGAHYMIKFGQHAIFHFPHDAFLRITKEYFGPNTIIRQLLTPHMEFVHTINFIVLFGKMSVLNAGGRGTPFIFDIQTCDREQVQGMLRVANSQKPVFTTRALNHKLQPYYEAIANYVSEVVDYWWPKASDKEKENIKTWGHALHHYMGFPVEKAAHTAKDATDRYENPNALYFKDQPKDMGLLTELDTDPKALKIILTDYIYRISVQHSADHWGFMQIPCNISPMVMRIPYSRNSYMSKKRPPYSRWDDIKGFMYNEVFVAWTNNQYFHDDRLMNAQYPYTDPKLQAMADAFRKSLTLAELAVPYGEIPLESICKTLEW